MDRCYIIRRTQSCVHALCAPILSLYFSLNRKKRRARWFLYCRWNEKKHGKNPNRVHSRWMIGAKSTVRDWNFATGPFIWFPLVSRIRPRRRCIQSIFSRCCKASLNRAFSSNYQSALAKLMLPASGMPNLGLMRRVIFQPKFPICIQFIRNQ
jgi:hypothetical protein